MDPFQADNIRHVDYKDVPRLRRFISDMGKIEPRRKSGANAKHQRSLAIAIKRARHLALLPYTEGVRDPNRPRRGGDRRTGGRPGGGPYRSQGYSSGPPRDGDGGDRDRSPQAE
jgi:small subunit ribosomal protein S18